MKKREIMALDLAVTRLYAAILQSLWAPLVASNWPLGKGLNIEIDRDALGTRVFIYPVGWPKDNYIFARFLEVGNCGVTPFEGGFRLPGIGIDYERFTLGNGFGNTLNQNWEIQFPDKYENASS